jgi:hypothetical protein
VVELVDALRKPVFVLNMARPGNAGFETRRKNACDSIRAIVEAALADDGS